MAGQASNTIDGVLLKTILGELRKEQKTKLVFAQAFGTTYQRLFKPGQTRFVLPQLLIPPNRKLVPDAELELDRFGSARKEISVEEGTYFNVGIMDIEQFQTSIDLQQELIEAKSDENAADLDSYLHEVAREAVNNKSNDLGLIATTDQRWARFLLADMRTRLIRQKKGAVGAKITAYCPPEVISALIRDPDVVIAPSTSGVLLNGEIGTVYGITIVEYFTGYNEAGTQAEVWMILGSRGGERINQFRLENEFIRSERYPGKIIRGFQVFGGLVKDAACFVKATIPVTAIGEFGGGYTVVTPPTTQTPAGRVPLTTASGAHLPGGSQYNPVVDGPIATATAAANATWQDATTPNDELTPTFGGGTSESADRNATRDSSLYTAEADEDEDDEPTTPQTGGSNPPAGS